MASDWNRFTSKIFKEGRAKYGKGYSFKQALKDEKIKNEDIENKYKEAIV
jgi:hypothetical protein